jgi:hypothetical protein
MPFRKLMAWKIRRDIRLFIGIGHLWISPKSSPYKYTINIYTEEVLLLRQIKKNLHASWMLIRI